MANNKWVEVEAKSIDDAIKAGLNELNLEDSTQADIKILREPEGGVFGVGGTKALVRISVRGGQGRSYSNNNRRNNNRRNNNNNNKPNNTRKTAPRKPRIEADKNEQLKVSTEFLDGLIKSFGLDGSVEGEIEDENLVVKVKGEQTEALVGDKGFIIRSLHELTRTVVQRKTGAGTRLRLDVADYASKRKEALTIYAERLSKQILEDKQEVMLEPMNSVGREPYRSVVFAPEEEE